MATISTKRRRALGAIAAAALTLIAAPASARTLSDPEIRQAVIRESLASYPGNCPCPYNVDRRGHACGRRSAYSRPGGYSPICYVTDVTPAMVREYRQRSGN